MRGRFLTVKKILVVVLALFLKGLEVA